MEFFGEHRRRVEQLETERAASLRRVQELEDEKRDLQLSKSVLYNCSALSYYNIIYSAPLNGAPLN